MGHAARCMSLIDRLLENGHEISVSSYGDALSYLAANGIPANTVIPVSYGTLPDGKVSIKMTIFKNLTLPIKVLLQLASEISYISYFKPSIVVSDTRISTVIASKVLGYPTLLILNQFNILIEYPRYRRFLELIEASSRVITKVWEMADRILISDLPPPYTLSKNNLLLSKSAESKSIYIGPIIDLPRAQHSSKEDICRRYGLSSNKPLIFIHLSGPMVERRALADKIERFARNLNRYSIIMTLGEANGNCFRRYENMVVMSWVEDPTEIYSASDIVVSRAGHGCITKALSFGKPLVLIPIRAHGEQKSNAQSVAEMRAGVILDEEDLNEETLSRALELVLEDDIYKANAERIGRLIRSMDPLGTALSIIERLGS